MTLKSTATIWFTNNIHSKTVCGALAEGTGFPLRYADEACDMPGKNPGPSIVYGLLRGCSEIIQRCQAAGEDWWHIDHGYIGRGHYDGYYRITKRGLQVDATRTRLEPRTYYKLSPWRKGGKYIVLIPPTLPIIAHNGSLLHQHSPEQHSWLDMVRNNLTQHELVVSTKAGPRFNDVKDDACAVIAYNSIAAIDALIYGIPTYQTNGVLGGGYAADAIDGWRKPDREPLLDWLTHQQFTLDEMRSGEAWKILSEVSP